MKLKPILIFIPIAIFVLILQEAIQNNRQYIHESLGDSIRILAPTQQDYKDKCGGQGNPQIKPKVDKNSGKILKSINQSRDQKDRLYLQDLLENKKPDSVKYLQTMIPFIAPFIVLFALSLVGYWYYCGCVCCKCYISCCGCIRRDPAKKPYTNCQICWPLITFLVFGGLCIAVCIFGLVATSNFIHSVDLSGCAVSLIFKDIIFGSKDDPSIKWNGTTGVISKLKVIQTGINDFGDAVTTAFGTGSTNFIATLETNLEGAIDNIDAEFDQPNQVRVENPDGSGVNLVIPFFQTIGPKTQSDKMSAQLKKGKDDTIIAITNGIKQMQSNSQTVQTNIADIRGVMGDAVNSVTDIDKNINDFGQTTIEGLNKMKPVLGYIQTAFIAIFSLLMALIGASIIGVLLAKLCKISCCRFLIHVGWCCSSWMLIFTLLLGIILFTVGIGMDDGCLSLNNLVTPQNLGKIDQISSSSQYIQNCLSEQGNPSMSDSLGLNERLSQIDSVTNSLNEYQSRAKGGGLTSNDFTALNDVIANINELSQNANLLMLRSRYETIPQASSWESVVENLTRDVAATCGGQNDFFVANDSQCAAGNATLGEPYGSGNIRCINVLTHTAGDGSYARCAAFNEIGITRLNTTLDGIIAHLNRLSTQITALRDSFNTQATRTNDFFTNTFTSFKTGINNVITEVSDKESGIISQLDCKWIGSRWRDFDTAFCDSTVPNFSLIGIALLLSAVFNVFIVCCGGCIAIRIQGSLSKPSHVKVPPSEKPDKKSKAGSKDLSARDQLSAKRIYSQK